MMLLMMSSPRGKYSPLPFPSQIQLENKQFNHLVKFRSRVLDLGPWIPGPESWTPDPEPRIQDPGARVLDPGSMMLDPGSRVLDLGH